MAPHQIIVCIDGTWNKPGRFGRIRYSGEPRPTNVFRTWAAAKGFLTSYRGPIDLLNMGQLGVTNNRVAVYLPGVGTSGSVTNHYLAGATGIGTSALIKQAYKYIAKHWRHTSQIYLFGFSRGAFAARSTAGMLNHCGLRNEEEDISEAELTRRFESYQSRTTRSQANANATKIKFLGIWDTVCALALKNITARFHDISPENVEMVRHALALDELRSQYVPVFWESGSVSDVKQVWFAGAHSNIGGGYDDDNLSNIAMFWMLKEAASANLKLDLPRISGWAREFTRKPIDSWDEFWTDQIGSYARIILNDKFKLKRTVGPDHFIHESVYDARLMKRSYKTQAEIADDHWRRIEPWGFPMTTY